MTSPPPSIVTGRPPLPPSAALDGRQIELLRLLCRGQSLQRIIIDWQGENEPTPLELACLQNRWAARIADLRKVWVRGMR